MGTPPDGPPRHPWRAVPAAARHPWRFLSALVLRVQEDDILPEAAAMAYYFFLSLFPFVLFVVALVSLAPVEGLEDWALGEAAEFLPAPAYLLLEGTIRDLLARPRRGLVSLGATLSLWTASSAFVETLSGLARAYRAREHRPWWQVRLHALGITVALSLLMIVAFVLTIFGGYIATLIGQAVGPAGHLAAVTSRWTIVVAAVTLVVAVIDHASPARPRRWRWLTPGSLVFMGGFAAASGAFSYYVGRFASYNATYGSLGAVIVLLFWMYLLAVFLLLGGEVNALLEHQARERAGQRAADGEAAAG